MKKLLLISLAILILFSYGCQSADTDETVAQDDIIVTEAPETEAPETAAPETEAPETEAPETAAPVILSPEMQKKLGSYMPKSWQTGIDEINEALPDDFMFAIQTDTHFSVTSGNQSANCLKALSHYIPLSFYANLGDYIKGYYQGETGKEENTPEKTMQSLKELTNRYLTDANCPVLVTFGNHDANQLWCKNYGTADQQLTRKDHYDEVISKLKEHNGSIMVNDGESNYYYVDFPAYNARVIMLNCADGNYENSFDSVSIFSDRQVEWFKTEALNTSANVIVMTHVPLIKEFPGNDSSNVKNGNLVREAVEEFVKNGGSFVAYMNGHTHAQSDMVDENGRLHISFASGGTKAEVVAINFKARKIYTFGLGGAEGRDFRY